MTITKPGSGNRTSKRGSRYIQRPQLDRETAKNIKLLVLARRLPYTPEAVAQWIAEQAEREWQAYDAEIQAAADEAYEGGVR